MKMDTAGVDYSRSPSSRVSEEEWMEKKKALLDRLSKEKGDQKTDRENLSRERERLISEVERLEEENHLMAKSVKDFELQLSKRRGICQDLYKSSDELKLELVEFLAREHNILNEIELLELEKARLSEVYSEVSGRLRTNIAELENTVNDIDFMKGEVGALMEKMEMIEGEVPVKFKDVDNLDEKIIGSIKALKGLYSRMESAKKDVKISYYEKKK
jgi:chromosome segregation ATPase